MIVDVGSVDIFRPTPAPPQAALGGSLVPAGQPTSNVLFSNPAALTLLDRTGHASAGYMTYLTDISYAFASAAFRPLQGRYGTIGATVMKVDYHPEDPRYSTAEIAAHGASLGYAHHLDEYVDWGVRIKYRAQKNFANYLRSAGPTTRREVEADFALLFSAQPAHYRLSVVAQNIFPARWGAPNEDGTPPALHRRFHLGGAVNLAGLSGRLSSEHAFWLTTNFQSRSDYPSYLGLGGTYNWQQRLSLRAGYRTPTDDLFAGERSVEANVYLGGGGRYTLGSTRLGLDYSYNFTPNSPLPTTHRLATSVAF